jgi:N-acetylglucosaminyl-diphospho-decaprenol L-rhamnosyltransferase
VSVADVVIVHWGHAEPTVATAEVALATGWQVTVVDNDGALPLQDGARLRVVRPGANLGFGRGVNLGAAAGDAPWILLLNPDTGAEPGALTRLVDIADGQEGVGVLAPSLVHLDGSPQIGGGRFTGWPRELARVSGAGRRLRALRARSRGEFRGERSHDLIDRGWVSGAAMLVRRDAFEAVGGFDERFFLYYEDEDLCRRIRARGWRVAVTPEVCVEHAVGESSPASFEASRALYHRLYSGPLLRRLVCWDSARRTRALG